jgi:hypothetical protein
MRRKVGLAGHVWCTDVPTILHCWSRGVMYSTTHTCNRIKRHIIQRVTCHIHRLTPRKPNSGKCLTIGNWPRRWPLLTNMTFFVCTHLVIVSDDDTLSLVLERDRILSLTCTVPVVHRCVVRSLSSSSLIWFYYEVVTERECLMRFLGSFFDMYG